MAVRVKDWTPPELKVGQILARDGAWQRKYKVLAITKDAEQAPNPRGYTRVDYVVELQFMGNVFADQRKDRHQRKATPTYREERATVNHYPNGQKTGLHLHRYVYDWKLNAKKK